MKIPQYVEAAIGRRERAARAWLEADDIITEFIEKKGLENIVAGEDYKRGSEGLFAAGDSGERIRQAITES